MINLQKEFEEFDVNIKLDDENEDLRKKREILLNKLKNRIANDAAPYTWFCQGSYAMHTGVKPEKGDYDIDVGLVFDIAKEDYPNPIDVKKWVYDALEGHTKSVRIRKSCVTVTYQEEGKEAYHVDFAIYVSSNSDSKLYIAKGTEHSAEKKWEVSSPKELISRIRNKFQNPQDAAQFRRVIRYLKKWRNHQFSADGNEAPSGIALTILAYSHFLPCRTEDSITQSVQYNDFMALKNLVESIKQCFVRQVVSTDSLPHWGISLRLIVEPRNDLFSKMTMNQKDELYLKFLQMSETLESVIQEEKRNRACEKLRKLFGEEFPIKYDQSIVGTSESAFYGN